MTDWFKKLTIIAVLGALTFLHIADLAFFDPDHDHIDRAHIQVHAADIVQLHLQDEMAEHETPDAMSAHLSFHTLLGVFLDSGATAVMAIPTRAEKFGMNLGVSSQNRGHRPPVPPPLV